MNTINLVNINNIFCYKFSNFLLYLKDINVDWAKQIEDHYVMVYHNNYYHDYLYLYLNHLMKEILENSKWAKQISLELVKFLSSKFENELILYVDI